MPKGSGFRFEAVSAVNFLEIAHDAQAFDDFAAEAPGLIGEHGHWAIRERFQAFEHPRIENRVVEHVRAIVRKEKIVRALNFFRRRAIAQGTLDQAHGALSDVAKNALVRKLGASGGGQRSVHGQREIELRIDQRAVQIEYQRANLSERACAPRHHEPPGNRAKQLF
jgi:hypothetical protein